MPLPDQRKHKRFDMRLAIELIRAGRQELGTAAETRNLSSRGVLFTSPAEMNVGESIEFAIKLPTGGGTLLRCIGKVVRQEKKAVRDESDFFHIAATMERYEFVRG